MLNKHVISLITELRERLLTGKLRFKDQSVNFPDWQLKQIKDVLKIGSGKDYRHLGGGSIPVFGSGGFITRVNSFLHHGETVCIGRKGTINKPIYHNGKIWTVDTLFYTHSFTDILPRFIFYVFQSIKWLEYNEASGVPSLSKGTIEKIQFKAPSVKEQTLISNVLSAIDKKIEIEKKILLRYQNLRKFLLKVLFI